MRSYGVLWPAAGVLAAGVGVLLPGMVRAAGPAVPMSEARREFVEAFERIPLNTAPGDAALLKILVESSGAQRGIEVGTATGYGAMFMGIGFERTGGELTTIDIDEGMVQTARRNLKEMDLLDTVTVVHGDALEVLPELEGEYDFLFIDAVKRDYLKYFRAVEDKLKPGAVIVGDNAIRSAEAMRDFLDAMRDDPRYEMVIVRASELKNDGMAVIHKLE